MISLKKPADEKNEACACATPDEYRAVYGYGTSINLEEEQVASLGIGSLQAGVRVRLVAYGVIESVRVEVGKGEGKCMSIQLTDMEAMPAASSDADLSNRLYPPKATS